MVVINVAILACLPWLTRTELSRDACAAESQGGDEDAEAGLLQVSLLQTTLHLQRDVPAILEKAMPAAAAEEPSILRESAWQSLVSTATVFLSRNHRQLQPQLLAAMGLGAAVLVIALIVCLWRFFRPSTSQAEEVHSSASSVQIGIYGMLLTQTLNALATMVVLPTMPFYAMTLGASAFEISLMNSGYNLAQMLFSPVLGTLSDRVGRKRVMIAGILCQAMCNGLMSYSSSTAMLMASRMGVGMALSTSPVEMAYIMDFVQDEKELSRVLSLQRVMTSAGALAGPVVARAFNSMPFPSLCRGVVAVNLLNLLIGLLLWKDAPKTEEPANPKLGIETRRPSLSALAEAEQEEEGGDVQSKSAMEQYRSMFANRTVRGLLSSSFVYTLGFGIGDGPEIVFFKERFGFSRDQTCVFYMCTNVATLVCSTWVPAFVENFGARTMCVVGGFGGGLCTLLLVFGPAAPWVPYVFGATMVGLFGTMMGLGLMHLVRESCDEDMLGTMLGLQSSLSGAAGALAPPLGGMLYGFNILLPFVSSSFFCALTGVMYRMVPIKALAASEQTPSPVVHRQGKGKRPQLKRLSTFGMPIFNDKSFMVQVLANERRLEFNPETRYLYDRYRELLREENVRGGMKPVATVAGGLSHAINAKDEQEEEQRATVKRTLTTGNLA